MKILTLLLVLSFGLVGCAKKLSQEIEPETMDTVLALEESFKLNGLNLKIRSSIRFANLEGNLKGKCIREGSGSTLILLDRDSWKEYGAVYRLFLLAHEVGHCELGREHTESLVTIDDSEVPRSIMHPDFSKAALHSGQVGENEYFQELIYGEQ